jgi:subtilisin family serine protease
MRVLAPVLALALVVAGVALVGASTTGAHSLQARSDCSSALPPVVCTTSPHNRRERLLVRLRADREYPVQVLAAAAGAEVMRTLAPIRTHVLLAPSGRSEEVLAALRRFPEVEMAERDELLSATEVAPNDFDWPDQWGLRLARFPAAWELVRGSAQTVIAVVDTGIDRAHPDLRGAVLGGYDFVNRDRNPDDDNGHGTAVAGILAARTNNTIGIAGACWKCALLPLKVLNAHGLGFDSDIAEAIIAAADRGAHVVNLSLGGVGASGTLSRALAYAATRDVVLVGAAGNDGGTREFYPAADGHVLAVAAANRSARLYPWSNRGAWVDLAAPGCSVALQPRNGYASICGTSAAAPLVAGLAALVRAANPSATAAEVQSHIVGTLTDVGGEAPTGRLNAAAATRRTHPPQGGERSLRDGGRSSTAARRRRLQRSAARGCVLGSSSQAPRSGARSLPLSEAGPSTAHAETGHAPGSGCHRNPH